MPVLTCAGGRGCPGHLSLCGSHCEQFSSPSQQISWMHRLGQELLAARVEVTSPLSSSQGDTPGIAVHQDPHNAGIPSQRGLSSESWRAKPQVLLSAVLQLTHEPRSLTGMKSA